MSRPQLLWTPVSVKPHPDHGGRVLITYTLAPSTSGPFVTSARFDCGHWDWGSQFANRHRTDADVIAWTEHPEPYTPTAEVA